VSRADAPDALRALGKRYGIPLTRGLKGEDLDGLLRAHSLANTWSTLEYACHMRDVLQIQHERLQRALVEDGYVPESMRRDERAVEQRYNEQVPAVVAEELALAATTIAADLEAFTDADWGRTMTYLYPERAERTLTWVAQHTVHEGEHHLLDVGRVLRAARGR
jgi:hypothetical protein